jgi:hypothetical protein
MRSTAATWVLSLAAMGCNGTEPIELASSYDLHTVEGDVPPRLIGATVECDVSVEGGRVNFGEAEQFELGLDVLTDCSRGGGGPNRATYGYTGTADVDGRRVMFHTATGSGSVEFEGVLATNGHLQIPVPNLVPTVNEVTVDFAPN